MKNVTRCLIAKGNFRFSKDEYYDDTVSNVYVSPGDTTIVNMVLHKPGTYNGIVMDYYDEPLPDVHVTAHEVVVATSIGKGNTPVSERIEILENDYDINPIILDVDTIMETWTNSAGEYSLVLDPGTYYVTYDTAGWDSDTSEQFEIVLDTVIANQNVILRCAGSLSGTVINDDTIPVEGVNVVVESDTFFAEDYTDEIGYYMISGIYDDDYIVTFSHDDYDSLILADTHINDCEDRTIDTTLNFSGYEYLPGDVNMANGLWPPMVIGGDVTYLVNYFKGSPSSQACLLDGFWCSADANGDCIVMGSDVIRLVAYFRGAGDIEYCVDYEPVWPPVPEEAPDGWPNCETPVTTSKVLPTGDSK